jgi:hypothetical protein
MAIPQERLRITERPAPIPASTDALRVAWGGVWSGLLIGIGVLMLLGTLGLAIGISAAGLGTGEGAGARSLGIGAGVWAGISLLIALFLGGMVAARMGLVFDRATSALQGALVWVLAMLGIVYLATSGISLGVSTLLGVAGGVARTATGAVTAGAGSLADLDRGDVDQILARLGDPRTIETVAAATGMSTDEARSTLADIRQRVETARNDPARAAAAARDGVQQLTARAASRAAGAAQAAQPYASATSWFAFGEMLLSLIAAVAGALWGAQRAALRIAHG